MGLFKSKAERELIGIMQRIEMNMSNNYKDAAQAGLKEFESAIAQIKESGDLKADVLAKYESLLDTYKIKLKGYTHKDQKPYWH
ncbi:MAG: hypothetical protein J6U67_00015 [Lachnospiraceae bacterium]|nr:hypothetical protein [Lachnospiraceae bacterium]